MFLEKKFEQYLMKLRNREIIKFYLMLKAFPVEFIFIHFMLKSIPKQKNL